ncbi:Lrp/AsnC family transcriptional regulator [Novispirillum itersonii]|uniref:Lrp/AsnC family leucine-responsive transcriptional regulator n=1 Tax=Novispirillum itersonii TaxID=189 RepID=A0A7X0DM43_NOVIT|nr:Lrp/AsnC family transcriptional regulator [Novispirillum itersonii]MBB6208817.1 Lrp/AsnC family leucine-responsive transcriptional regulator [Novispirillum itersonii]
MDAMDRRLLSLLQDQGRSSYADLGAAVGLSVSGVADRIRRLEASGVLQGWTVRVDPVKAGLDILAFIFVAIERPEWEPGFLTRMRQRPEVLECHHVTGDWSYLLKVRVGSVADLEGFLATGLKDLPGLGRTHTQLALSSPKETNALPLAGGGKE